MINYRKVSISEALDIPTEELRTFFIEDDINFAHEYFISDADLIKLIKSKDPADLSVNEILKMIEQVPRYIPK